jgi:hypothetical protein
MMQMGCKNSAAAARSGFCRQNRTQESDAIRAARNPDDDVRVAPLVDRPGVGHCRFKPEF